MNFFKVYVCECQQTKRMKNMVKYCRFKILYVGQTNDSYGTLRRAMAHIHKQGTLRKRFEEHTGDILERADDLTLVSFRLPQIQKCISIETSYREAVEYLVQSSIQKIRGKLKPVVKVISNVRYSDRVTEPSVSKFAEHIIQKFVNAYSLSS